MILIYLQEIPELLGKVDGENVESYRFALSLWQLKILLLSTNHHPEGAEKGFPRGSLEELGVLQHSPTLKKQCLGFSKSQHWKTCEKLSFLCSPQPV